jgi:L-threonylcarbamoyladenylate synthase
MIISIADAVSRLRREEIVAIPTETVYGLAGAINSELALKEIFARKQRAFFDPLIVHVPVGADLSELALKLNDLERYLIEHCWPGPLTLIVKKHPKINQLITAGLEYVGLRCPDHAMAQEILNAVGIPLAAPSANLFKKVSPTCVQHVEDEFQGQVPVVDGGPSTLGVESTVVQVFEASKELRIYRAGHWSKDQLEVLLNRYHEKNNERWSVYYHSSPVAPGQMQEHYRPHGVDLTVMQLSVDQLQELHQQGIQQAQVIPPSLQKINYGFYLGEDPLQAARLLYHMMRECNQLALKSGHQQIYALLAPQGRGKSDGPEQENWEMVLQRLRKAASQWKEKM